MLLQNKTIYAQYPVSFSGGATGNERSQKGQRGVTNANKYMGFAGIPMSSGIPNGYGIHYGYGKRIKIIGFTPDNTFYTSMSITNGAIGNGIINIASITGLKRMVALINGVAVLDADVRGIGYIVKELVGVASVNAGMAALVSMVANLPGSGNVTSALSLISSAVCQILSSGTLSGSMSGSVPMEADIYSASSIEGDITGSTFMIASVLANAILNGDIEGEGNMSAEVYMGAAVEPLSPTALAAAVWNALASEFNNSGTMGQKLNLASSGGVDLDALRDAVWNAVQTNYTTDGTFGKYLDQAISQIDVSQSSAGINASAIGFELISGTIISGTYDNVRTLDGNYHEIYCAPWDAGSIDINYTFNIGKNAIPSQATFTADLYGGNDDLFVMAWNYVNSTWETIGIRSGDNNRTPTSNTYNILQTHVGTGLNSGEVKIRFYSNTLTKAEFRIDQLLITYAVISRSVGFQGQVVSGDETHIVLGSEASSVDDYYKPGLVVIVSGTGADQYARIESYYGSTRMITVATPFSVSPDNTSFIQITPWGSVRVSDIDSGIEILEAIKKKTNMIPGLY